MFIYNLEAIAEKLKIDYDRVTSQIKHNGVKGTAREDLLKANLKGLFPERYSICSGIIIDSDQNQSRQQDFIIYDSFNCPSFFATESNKVLPIESVYSTIEIKSKLTKKTLLEAIKNVESVRKLKKQSSFENYPVGFIFAYTSDSTLGNIQKALFEFNKDILPEHQVSIVCVLDKGLIFNVSKHNLAEYVVYPSKDTILGSSASNLVNNLYSFYLLVLQYLNSVTILVPNLLEYAKKMDAFKVGVSIPMEILPRDGVYRLEGFEASVGDIQDLLELNKKYPNLFSNKFGYDELYKFMVNDLFFTLETFGKMYGNDNEMINLNFYGYDLSGVKYLNLKYMVEHIDENDNREQIENIVRKIYNCACNMRSIKENYVENENKL